jgi:hypothetical protein
MIAALLRKEFVLEFRQKSTLGGVVVYVAGAIFISALCFRGGLSKPAWNALFWVISLFTSVTISGKSFLKETGGQALFSYLYYEPRKFILAKVLYNMIFMLCLSCITFFFYSFFIGNQVENMELFFIVMLFASSGLAGILSLMSAIAAKAGHEHPQLPRAYAHDAGGDPPQQAGGRRHRVGGRGHAFHLGARGAERAHCCAGLAAVPVFVAGVMQLINRRGRREGRGGRREEHVWFPGRARSAEN